MKNKMISMALFALSLLSLAGCQGEESIPVDLAVITLNGRNMPACDPSVLKNVVVETASGVGSTVSLILADGEPALEQSLTFGEWEGKSTYMRDKELEERYQQVSALLAESRAQEEESDLVRGIGLAARALHSGSGSEKRLVVVHSGINTCSPLAMQDLPDLTVLGPSTVEELAEADYLADLSGCSVDWYFLGDTAGEQETLSGAQVEALRTFWDTFLTACGGTEITFHSDLPSGNEVENAPGVAVVMPASYDIHQDIPLKVEFKPDSSQFQNEDVARSQLAELADALAVDGGKYLLAGCAADMETVSKEYGQNLGLERAQAVRQLMLELGASEDQLTCLGVGKAVTSVQDTDQAQNRAVWLTPADSALAEEFRAVGIQE